MPEHPVKTRFAPSPTGFLHLGNARTALFSALLARHHGGRFLLRVEDTDRERSEDRYVRALMEDLRWLGLDWDEGPDAGGDAGPYHQSERNAVYADLYARLEEQGLVYPCFCSSEELELSRKAQINAGQPPRYSGKCARIAPDEARVRLEQGEAATLRFRVPKGETIEFEDVVRGTQRFVSDDIGDFIIRRADGTPSFFFTNAVDDALMGVSHVVRGEDHITNTPRQIMLLRALGLPVPDYAHIAMIVAGDGSPLSKRHGSLGLAELRAAGFLPGALVNFLARMGHYYGHDEYRTLDELAGEFAVDRLSRAPAGYDDARLLYWQKEAVAHADHDELWAWVGAEVRERVPEADREAFITAIRDNVQMPADAEGWARVFYDDLTLDAEARDVVQDAGGEFFLAAVEALALHGTDFKAFADEVKQRTGTKGRALFMPLRAALTGQTHGPEMGAMLPLIGADRARRRLEVWVSSD